jgi:hypothetical protein
LEYPYSCAAEHDPCLEQEQPLAEVAILLDRVLHDGELRDVRSTLAALKSVTVSFHSDEGWIEVATWCDVGRSTVALVVPASAERLAKLSGLLAEE